MNYSKEQQQTFLETLNAQIERAEKGTIEELFQGKNVKVPVFSDEQIKYFTSQGLSSIDCFGNMRKNKQ